MNHFILSKDIQEFIDEHLASSIPKLIFKGSPFKECTIQELAEQIESKNKCKKKLPTWFQGKNIYYPNKLNIEQTSSEITAKYKSALVLGESIIDLTGGFGVDSFYFSKVFKTVVHCEINTSLSEIVAHNYKQLNKSSIKTISKDGIEFLLSDSKKYDCIYVDPSRRNETKGKVFLLNDCTPNIPRYLDKLFEHSNNLLIKYSPILDIKSALKELKFTKEIHIVAVKNEVKELLFLLEKDFDSDPMIKTVNFVDETVSSFNFGYNTSNSSEYSLPQKYLYEPNAAILKSGGFHEITSKFDVFKLHQHSHLYTNTNLIDFPGRRFVIEHCISADKKLIKKHLPKLKANVTTRNYPQSVSEIRKKFKLKDGGEFYLFFTTNLNDKFVVFICKKV
ncbi:MAG: class I SAM-dependent methyltransferase [Flavobacteriaceae bacterium]|nr:class I SAM-dependent methyltransferase [Flavobacteriaceae bacterium]